MSLTWDPTPDHEVFDGTETVTIKKKGTRTVSDSGVVSYAETTETVTALRRQVSNRQIAASGGSLKVGDCVWEVPYLSTITPKISDELIDASSNTWRIVWVDDKPVLEMWRVFGRL